MSVLDFFEDIKNGRVRDPLSIEYAGFLGLYEGSYVIKEDRAYRLTRDGERHLSGLRMQLAEVLAAGLPEGDGYENSGAEASDTRQ